MTTALLRACPTCGTKVGDVDLGLRDFRWVNSVLPGKVGMMDIDGVLERNGNFLALEFKPKGALLGKGALITYKVLVKQGWTVLVVHGDEASAWLTVHELTEAGFVNHEVSVQELADMVNEWFAAQ